jgi:hypothetical protein
MEDGDEDGEIDYSRYTARELHEALAGIRREEYPKNYANILAALSAVTEHVEDASVEDTAHEISVASSYSPLINITQRTRDIIFWSGMGLLIVGLAIVYWAFQRFDELPNYLRIAIAIPATTSYAMLRIDQYRNWDSVKGLDRGHAIGALLVPPLLLLGSLFWLVTAPDARG